MLSQRASGEGFAFRLFLGVALTLLAGGAGSYALIGDRVRAETLDDGQRALQQEVRGFEETSGRQRASRVELRRFADRLQGNGEFADVGIFDSRGRLAAGTMAADRTDAIRTTLRAGKRHYALVAQIDESHLEDFLSSVRDGMVVFALPALAFSLGLFWLLAGRAVQQRHRFALERARRDGLTGLGNHRAFQDELARALSLTDRTNLEMALVVFDVDDFKFLNDRRGHQYGDEILRRVAKILGSARAQDRAFRTGGDEFVLLMPATGEHDAHGAAARIGRLMGEAGITASCGVSATRPDMRSAAVLREEAEAALQDGKRRRSSVPVKFSDVRGRAVILTPEKIHQLRLMIEDGAIDVAVQPIWDIVEGQLIGLEALARPHPDYGLAGPAEAFDVAEQIGRIGDLDRLCVNRILAHAGELPRGVRLFLNIHPSSLDDGDDGGWLLDALRAARVTPGEVVIEVTERSGARVAGLARSVQRLRSLGFKVALDDLGAGNSGLELMHLVPVDFVKVDRSIVARAPFDKNARAALAAVAAFAHETGTFVIAEGIEDLRSLDFVRRLRIHSPTGIRGGQGYGLGRPAGSVAEATAKGAQLLVRPSGVLDDATLDAVIGSRPDPASTLAPRPMQSGA